MRWVRRSSRAHFQRSPCLLHLRRRRQVCVFSQATGRHGFHRKDRSTRMSHNSVVGQLRNSLYPSVCGPSTVRRTQGASGMLAPRKGRRGGFVPLRSLGVHLRFTAGTVLAGGPPHGSVREELPQTAPALGDDAENAHAPCPAHSTHDPGSESGPRVAGQSSPWASASPPVPYCEKTAGRGRLRRWG